MERTIAYPALLWMIGFDAHFIGNLDEASSRGDQQSGKLFIQTVITLFAGIEICQTISGERESD